MWTFCLHLIVGLVTLLSLTQFKQSSPRRLGILALALFLTSLIAGTSLLAWAIFLIGAGLLSATELRRKHISSPILKFFKKALPPISQTEREAIEAGNVWWDAELFSGAPKWHRLLEQPMPELSDEEQAYLKNEVATLLTMLDDWKIMQEDKDLPENVWQYIRDNGFLSMMIDKKYGGRGFSELMHSTVVGQIASKSASAAVTVMVPNSLGPAELLHAYGTEAQKNHYLPRLASGEELPCFALTGPEAGSDAGAIPDTGTVIETEIDGKKQLALSLTFEKRYITLAPVATVMGLAFKLHDPDHLLGDTEKSDYGITVCLIPTNTNGIKIGNRHLPMGAGFMNGTIRGENVIVPIDAIVGGMEYAGKGWLMLMECLSAGRSISLPALSTASAQLCYRTTGAYSQIRKQFKLPIAKFEGVIARLAEIAGFTYLMEAARLHTSQAIDNGEKPAVVSAIMKYHMTELGRKVIENSMDIHAGKALILGPKNYLAHAYITNPIGITVEGANILTRNLMIFGQGVIRCHPYILQEMEISAKSDSDPDGSLDAFDQVLIQHIEHTTGNLAKSLWHGLTKAHFADSPVDDVTSRYFKQINRLSAALGWITDVSLLTLGGALKRKERLSARLGDVLSHLYMGSIVLKHFQAQGRPNDQVEYVKWCLDYCLHQCQSAIYAFCDNFPRPWIGKVLKRTVFPLGQSFHAPNDRDAAALLHAMLSDSPLRAQLTHLSPLDLTSGKETQNPGVIEVEKAFIASLETTQLEKKVLEYAKSSDLKEESNWTVLVQSAVKDDIISHTDAEKILEAYALRSQAIQVDEFDHHLKAVSESH